MRVLLAGASGLIGTALDNQLRRSGHEVHRLVRRPAHTEGEWRWNPATSSVPAAALQEADAVVNLAGAPITGGRTPTGRTRILSSRLQTTRTLATAMAVHGPGVLVQGSAIGYYGSGSDLTEQSPAGDTFLAMVSREWEASTAPAQAAGVRVALARTGIVLSADGGALGPLLPLLKAGLAGPLGNGRQWWSWITLRDEVRALMHLVNTPIHGPVNLVAASTRQRELIQILAHRLHRPARLPVPAPAIRLALGPLATEVLGSLQVRPEVLDGAGFTFTDTGPESAADYLFG